MPLLAALPPTMVSPRQRSWSLKLAEGATDRMVTPPFLSPQDRALHKRAKERCDHRRRTLRLQPRLQRHTPIRISAFGKHGTGRESIHCELNSGGRCALESTLLQESSRARACALTSFNNSWPVSVVTSRCSAPPVPHKGAFQTCTRKRAARERRFSDLHEKMSVKRERVFRFV